MQVAVLNGFLWSSFGWCGSTHGWILLFLETIGLIEPQIEGKMCPKTNFLSLDQTVWSFLRKKIKNFIGYPISKKKKGYIHFYLPTPRSLKNGDAPPPPQKKKFRFYFGKYCFSGKKLLNENIQNADVYKNGYINFCPQTPPSPQNDHVLLHMVSSPLYKSTDRRIQDRTQQGMGLLYRSKMGRVDHFHCKGMHLTG